MSKTIPVADAVRNRIDSAQMLLVVSPVPRHVRDVGWDQMEDVALLMAVREPQVLRYVRYQPELQSRF